MRPRRRTATRRALLGAGVVATAQAATGARAAGPAEERFDDLSAMLSDTAERATGGRVAVPPLGLTYEVAPAETLDRHLVTAGGARLRLAAAMGDVPLAAFGGVADGAADDGPAFAAALRWCSAHGADLLLRGVVGLREVTLTGEALDVTVRGGRLRLLGGDGLLRLERCRGRIAFEGTDVDGARRPCAALFRASEDRDLTFRFEGGAVEALGAPGAAASFCRFEDAGGGVRGTAFTGWACTGGQLISAGYGAFGVVDVIARRGDGNAVRLGALTGEGTVRPGLSWVEGGRFEDIDDTTRSRGQYGNAVVAWRVTGHRVSGIRASRVYASFVRENAASGLVSNNVGTDCGLVGGFHELGASRSVWVGNRFSDCGSDGINAANPDEADAGGPPSVLIAGNVLSRIGHPTTHSGAALAASLPGDHSAGKEHAAGISLAFGTAIGNVISDVAPGRLGESCGIRTAAQHFNREVLIGPNHVVGADYLVGVGASNAKAHGIHVSGVAGEHRRAPIAGLGGGYRVVDLAGGRGDRVTVRDMRCPRSLRPATLAPGSEITDPETGHTARFVGRDADSGRWSDEVAVERGAYVALGAAHLGTTTRLESSEAQVLAVPAGEGLPAGVEAVFVRTGAGAVRVEGAPGVRVEGVTAPERGAVLRLRRLAPDLWVAG